MVLLDWPQPYHLWIGRKSRPFVPSPPMQLDEQRSRNEACSDPGTGSELPIPMPAAQTRIVSGGPFGQAERRLSRDLKYMAGARIPEFESHMPSQADRSPTSYALKTAR